MTNIIASQTLTKRLDTRLGEIEYTNRDLFTFKHGLYGFEDLNEYIVTLLPNADTPDVYRCLQSLEEPELAIVLMNVTINPDGSGIINRHDLTDHLQQRNLNLEDVTVYLVTSIRNEDGRQRVSVNTKAPILLAPNQQEGWQVILESPNYKVSHYLV